MDNAMVKRGIGALVLAIIAALLLGWLLKDKSQERQEMVEMKLPGAPEMNIPSLTGNSDEPSSVATLVNETTTKVSDSIQNAGTEVVASATGAMAKVKDALTAAPSSSTENASTAAKNPGFAIRPPNANEQREVVDTTSNDSTAAINESKTDESAAQAKSKNQDIVVASTSTPQKVPAKKFTPTIVEEKKKVVKKKVVATKKVAKPTPTKAKVEKPAETASFPTSTIESGKYSIQLLATSSKSRASKLAKTMKSEGYTSFITQTTKNGKTLFRVRLGAHDNRKVALKAQQGLKRRYQKNFFVQNSLVISN